MPSPIATSYSEITRFATTQHPPKDRKGTEPPPPAHGGNGFDLIIPALHIAFREMAAAGIHGQALVQRDADLAHKATGLSHLAIIVALERQGNMTGETVVDLQRRYVGRSDPGHV